MWLGRQRRLTLCTTNRRIIRLLGGSRRSAVLSWSSNRCGPPMLKRSFPLTVLAMRETGVFGEPHRSVVRIAPGLPSTFTIPRQLLLTNDAQNSCASSFIIVMRLERISSN